MLLTILVKCLPASTHWLVLQDVGTTQYIFLCLLVLWPSSRETHELVSRAL